MTRINIKDLAQQRFIATPKLLLYGENYKSLSGNAFKTYVALYDRFTLSVKNNWVDEKNNVYFVYDLKELEEITCIGERALRTARKELRKADLLEEENTGRNYKLYLSMPVPKNEKEAKFIITEQNPEHLKDTSKMNEKEKEKISKNLKGNQNSKKTDDTAQRSIAVETLSEQYSPINQKQTILHNAVSDNAQRSTNDTVLNDTQFKDIKDNKETKYENQNTLLENGILKNENDLETSKELINEYIDNEGIEVIYGNPIIRNFKKYSHGDFITFKTFYEKLFFATKAIEEEQKVSIMLDEPITAYGEEYQIELSRAFWRAIQQHKANKIKTDFNNYLFGVFKQTLNDIVYNIESEKKMNKQN